MNRRLSFRLRILLVASLVVGAVLAIVIALSWSGSMQRQVEQLDQWLCVEAWRVAEQGRPDPGLESDIRDKLQLASTDQLLVAADYGQQGTWRSAHWPESLRISSLSWILAPPLRNARRTTACDLASFELADSQWHAARAAAGGASGFVAADLAAMRAELAQVLRRTLLIMVPLALTLTALSGWLLAAFATRPLNRLREAMKQMTPHSLDQRLPERGADQEFRELISAYNTMLERLESSFNQASRFSANAAHELKTPLTILQGRIEHAMRESDQPQQQQLLSGLLEEVSHLSAITRKLLLLAQADAGRLALNVRQIDWSDLLMTLLADAQLLVERQHLTSEIEPALRCSGDALLLRQLCNNLISNAVRYSTPDGWIKVSARAIPGGIETLISNDCLPVSPIQRQRFFDRFYRGDSVRQQGIEGSGLGLSLAREIARAHGGDLSLLPSSPEVVQLRLWLPTG